jgi:hypothetical protein
VRSVSILPPGVPAVGTIQKVNPPFAELTKTVRTSQNYFVLCMSAVYDPRLLTDFQADAVLIIRKPDLLIRRLKYAAQKVRPELKPWFGPVEYYDPYKAGTEAARIPMLKHFRYAYQNEFRFAWLTPDPNQIWEPFFVHIGPIRDISDIYL